MRRCCLVVLQRPKVPSEFEGGYFVEPTVIAVSSVVPPVLHFTPKQNITTILVQGLTYKARCAQEEIFGPVVTLHKFDTEVSVSHGCCPVGGVDTSCRYLLD